ncbi:hypothetical protein RUM44_004883 [Polyplax serrata]|uniref:Uncharacterized protein n=1 Tax=Polyplax serrata TaxID=468196 RepID=A0ABR1B5Y3_POLSC
MLECTPRESQDEEDEEEEEEEEARREQSDECQIPVEFTGEGTRERPTQNRKVAKKKGKSEGVSKLREPNEWKNKLRRQGGWSGTIYSLVPEVRSDKIWEDGKTERQIGE